MNESTIWKKLTASGMTKAGAAGLMGNLYAESALNPKNLQNSYEKSLGYSDESYTSAVDSGKYTNFIHDSAGYGLAQWTFWTRKSELLNFARRQAKSVGDLDMQIDFLIYELKKSYYNVWKTLCSATDVKEASDKVLFQYENPKKQDAFVQNQRFQHSMRYYNLFALTENTDENNNIQKKEGNFMKGIDVSKHNGFIDWNKVKADGVQFAILRAGYGKLASQKDVKFEEYYQGAKAAGIPIGAYWYSYAATVADARLEAEICVSVLKGKQFEYPIYFDLEEKKAFATGKANCSAMIRAFCEVLEKAGYWAGLYMSRSPFTDYTEENIRTRYALWLAEYNTKLNYSGSVGMWQKSSKGRVNGISGNVDIDEGYIDYPAKVRAAGLNGFPKEAVSKTEITTPATDEPEITQEESKQKMQAKISLDGKSFSGTLEED